MLASDATSTSPHITGTATASNGRRFQMLRFRKLIALSFQILARHGTVQDALGGCRPQVGKTVSDVITQTCLRRASTAVKPASAKAPQVSTASMGNVALTAGARTVPVASMVNATGVGTVRDERCPRLLEFNAVLMIRLPRVFVTAGIKHSLCQTTLNKRKWLQHHKIIAYDGMCRPSRGQLWRAAELRGGAKCYGRPTTGFTMRLALNPVRNLPGYDHGQLLPRCWYPRLEFNSRDPEIAGSNLRVSGTGVYNPVTILDDDCG